MEGIVRCIFGLSSQAMILPERAAIQACRQKFGIELEDGYFFKRGSFQVRNDWALRHGELLASLVLPGGRVYWADTIAEHLASSSSAIGLWITMLDSVVRFLEQAYLNTFLTDKGKQILAHRFTGSETASLEQGDQFLRSFKSRLDNSGKRRLAWAMMTLIAEDVIVPKKERNCWTMYWREAERISPAARRPILQEGFLLTFRRARIGRDNPFLALDQRSRSDGHTQRVDVLRGRRNPQASPLRICAFSPTCWMILPTFEDNFQKGKVR
jgi:hypothetical protein